MKIAILGCGNIGTGLAQRLSQSNQISLLLYDRDTLRMQALARETQGMACQHPHEAITQADWIILAVKPQSLKEVAEQTAAAFTPNQILISLLAGISLSTLQRYFSTPCIVRMMPNLALIYGEGVIGLSEKEDLSFELKGQLEYQFKPLGKIFWIPETKMDALTSLIGSGPAYVFTLIESMIDAGIALGFNAMESQELIIQMIKGSLTLLEQSGQHPGALRWQITSPGGTTIEGQKKLEEGSIRGLIMHAFLAAYAKAKTLDH